MATRREIYQAQSDNWRYNSSHDGIDPEVMKDIGYMAFDEIPALVSGLPADSELANQAGRTVPTESLTSSQKNDNARRATAEHLGRTSSQVIRYRRV